MIRLNDSDAFSSQEIYFDPIFLYYYVHNQQRNEEWQITKLIKKHANKGVFSCETLLSNAKLMP